MTQDRKYIYTVGEVAKICRVDPRTVSSWIDSGRLAGFRINTHRRVPEEVLIKFMENNQIPIPPEMKHPRKDPTLVAGTSIPKDSWIFFKDGNQWCCVRPDFIDLLESLAGFGLTFSEAYYDLTEREKLSERLNPKPSCNKTNDVNGSGDGAGNQSKTVEESSRGSEIPSEGANGVGDC